MTTKEAAAIVSTAEQIATDHAVYSKKQADTVASLIAGVIFGVVNTNDPGNTASTIVGVIKRERKDRPDGTPPAAADYRVAANILKGALLANEPLHRWTGIRIDLATAGLVGAHERFREDLLGACGGYYNAVWVYCALERTREVVFDGRDRGALFPRDARVGVLP